MATPEFQFGDVVRFKDEYIYDTEDADGLWRGMFVCFNPNNRDLFHLLVISAGAVGEVEVGLEVLMPANMFQVDNKKGESK